MQALNQTDLVPPGGWTYTVEGTDLRGTSLDYLLNNVREFYFANHMTPPKNLELLIMDSICQRLPVKDQEVRCMFTEPPTWAQLLVRAGSALSQWASRGFPLVTKEQLLERRNTCMECSFWHGEAAFGIGKCGSCGCTGVKLQVATEKCPQDKWEATV